MSEQKNIKKGPVPIPAAWKKDYPHFIAPLSSLRLASLVILIVTGIVFLFSCFYYYEFDQDIIGEIDFFLQTEEGWSCKSIGTYNGQYVFADFDKLSVNLSQSTAIGYVGSVFPYDNSVADAGYFTYSIPTSNSMSFNMSAYQLYEKAIKKKIDHYTYDLTWGAAPTIDRCLDMMQEGACNTIHNASALITDVSVYKFKFTVSTISATSVTLDDLGLFDTRPYLYAEGFQGIFHQTTGENSLAFSPFLSYTSNDEYFAAVHVHGADNLCDSLADGIANKEIFWGMRLDQGRDWINYDDSVNITCKWQGVNDLMDDICDANNGTGSYRGVEGFDISYECESVSDDYCIVNASEQFTFEEQNPLPTNTRIRGIKDLSYTSQFLLLGPELGTLCEDRWQSVCLDNYDITGYCNNVYSPPYSCTKTERKSLWAIVSLAFASSQLASMILVASAGFFFTKFATATDAEKTDEREQNVKKEIEMGENKTTNEEEVEVVEVEEQQNIKTNDDEEEAEEPQNTDD